MISSWLIANHIHITFQVWRKEIYSHLTERNAGAVSSLVFNKTIFLIGWYSLLRITFFAKVRYTLIKKLQFAFHNRLTCWGITHLQRFNKMFVYYTRHISWTTLPIDCARVSDIIIFCSSFKYLSIVLDLHFYLYQEWDWDLEFICGFWSLQTCNKYHHWSFYNLSFSASQEFFNSLN